jgi:hypothetical protein
VKSAMASLVRFVIPLTHYRRLGAPLQPRSGSGKKLKNHLVLVMFSN